MALPHQVDVEAEAEDGGHVRDLLVHHVEAHARHREADEATDDEYQREVEAAHAATRHSIGR